MDNRTPDVTPLERIVGLPSPSTPRAWAKLSGAALFVLASVPAQSQVRFEEKADRIAVEVNGKPFTVLHYGKAEGKPYLHPLLTASGKAVTRGFPDDPLPGDPTDRPHLRGLIVGHEEVSTPSGGELDFWENDPHPWYKHKKGFIVVKEAKTAADGPDRGTISLLNHWVTKEGQIWVVEGRKMTFYSKPADSRMLDVDIELEAREEVTFHDEKDGVMGLRLSLPFTRDMEGKVINSKGGLYQEGVRGNRAAWIDWIGDLKGEKVGVAVFDHPSNLHYPNRWHARDFAQVNIGPFGGKIYAEYPTADPKAQWDDWSVTLKPGEKLKLRYRVLIHPAAGLPAGEMSNDIERMIDQAQRPLVDQRVYDAFNDWTRQK
jgi:hypothetical protein